MVIRNSAVQLDSREKPFQSNQLGRLDQKGDQGEVQTVLGVFLLAARPLPTNILTQ